MFASATLKLTVWYLVILVAICLIFSFIIFELSTSEISNRLERLQIRVEGSSETLTLPGPVTLTDLRVDQTEEARASIFVGLVYMNLSVIALGGAGSFFLAKRTLRPIEEAHEAQSRFTSDASHELRTPLAIMKSEIQVAMRDSDMTDHDFRELLLSNLEEVDKLSELSQSLLQMSRLEDGDLKRSDRIDIGDTVHNAAKSLKIPTKRLVFTPPDRPIVVDGNEATLNDLLRILLDNAVKYSPPMTPITVTLDSNGRNCRLVVTNLGKGISQNDLTRVFDRFYRSEKSRTSSGHTPGGYGLGLALAKKIVALHDGSISASSTPGTSTNFTVTLPQVRKNR
jgi:two-component system sensor histidine kinase CiaH